MNTSHYTLHTLIHTNEHPHEEGLIGEGAAFSEVFVQLGIGESNGGGDVMVQDEGEYREIGVDCGIPARREMVLTEGCYES